MEEENSLHSNVEIRTTFQEEKTKEVFSDQNEIATLIGYLKFSYVDL